MTILSLNKTVHQCILYSTQSNCCSEKLDFLSPELGPHNSPELKPNDYDISGVTQQHEHEMKVARLNKLSQRPVEVWQCNSTSSHYKDAIFVFLHFAR